MILILSLYVLWLCRGSVDVNDSLTSDLIYVVLVAASLFLCLFRTFAFKYLPPEVFTAQGALSLHFEPISAAIMMKVVLLIARKDDELICGAERGQAYSAVRHVMVLQRIIAIADALLTLDIVRQCKLTRFLGCSEQESLNIALSVNTTEKLAPSGSPLVGTLDRILMGLAYQCVR